jgi:hypothetical protein
MVELFVKKELRVARKCSLKWSLSQRNMTIKKSTKRMQLSSQRCEFKGLSNHSFTQK